MEITLNLPEKTLRKIRAFSVLSGANPNTIDDTIVKLIDKSVASEILNHLDMSDVKTEERPFVMKEPEVQDVTGISAGLGDVDTSDDEEDSVVEGLKEADALIPQSGGLTDADLEKDMFVDDPSTEAKADATSDAEHLFQEILGLDSDEEDPRAARRRKQSTGRKAKVRPMSVNERV